MIHSRGTLFCFPYAGGDRHVYHGWREALAPLVDVHAVQLPGRGRLLKEPALRSMGDAIDYFMGTLSADGQIFLFGYSMGALLAFEFARALCQHGSVNLAHLFVAACRAPSQPRPQELVHQLDDAEFMKELRHLAGTPDEILQNAELMHLLLPTLRTDFQLCETYHYIPNSPLATPITAFSGINDGDHCPRTMAAWRHETCAPFRLHTMDGGHFFIHSARSELLTFIQSYIGAALDSSPLESLYQLSPNNKFCSELNNGAGQKRPDIREHNIEKPTKIDKKIFPEP